jgi:hypothetical protein
VSDEPAARGDDETLHILQTRLDRASAAAERLIADAAERVAKQPPPAGWQAREPVDTEDAGAGGREPGARPRPQGELELLLAALRSLRDVIPPELQQRLGEALREVLLALRALIDWYLERTERRRREPTEVQDIPIS